MSCPHGFWHEEDCEICAAQAQVEKLRTDLDTAISLLRRIEEFPENMVRGSRESDLQRDVRTFLAAAAPKESP